MADAIATSRRPATGTHRTAGLLTASVTTDRRSRSKAVWESCASGGRSRPSSEPIPCRCFSSPQCAGGRSSAESPPAGPSSHAADRRPAAQDAAAALDPGERDLARRSPYGPGALGSFGRAARAPRTGSRTGTAARALGVQTVAPSSSGLVQVSGDVPGIKVPRSPSAARPVRRTRTGAKTRLTLPSTTGVSWPNATLAMAPAV